MFISSIGSAANTIANAAAHAAQDVGPVAPETSHPDTTERRITNPRVAGTVIVGSASGATPVSPSGTTTPPVKFKSLLPNPPPITPNPLTSYVPPGGLHPVAAGETQMAPGHRAGTLFHESTHAADR